MKAGTSLLERLTTDSKAIIIGGGRVGRAAAQTFMSEGIDDTIIDRLAERRRSKPSYVIGDAADRSGPDFDGEAGVLIVERVEMPRDVRGFFADGADVEFVAGSVGPVSEMTVVHPATSVMHFVVGSYTWPD